MFKQTSLGAQGCADRAALCRLLAAHMHAQRWPAWLPCMQCPDAGEGKAWSRTALKRNLGKIFGTGCSQDSRGPLCSCPAARHYLLGSDVPLRL